MLLKGSSPKDYCPFCFHTEYIEVEILSNGRKRCSCLCGYTWVKESWLEMMCRTGKVWKGHMWDSDYEESLTQTIDI